MTIDPIPKPLPENIQTYAADFRWDNSKLWALELPTETIDINELTWHLSIPWLHTPNGRFDVTPTEIMENPESHKAQYERTMESDINYPIDIMFIKGRWLILDGLHRLMKSIYLGHKHVTVRKVPHSMIAQILK